MSSWDDSLFEKALDPMMIVAVKDKKIVRANPAFSELAGNITLDFSSMSPHQKLKKARAFDRSLVEQPGHYEDIIIETAHGLKTVNVSVSHAVVSDQNQALLIFQDITEKKQLERDLITKHQELENAYSQLAELQTQVVHAGKLAALGELAAGVSHEINQPLTGVRGFAQEINIHLKKNTQMDSKVLQFYSGEIIKNVDRMSHIIRHLRNFARQGTQDFVACSINDVVQNSLLLLKKQIENHGIEVEVDLPDNIPEVHGNPFELEQVIINLVVNARDAIQESRRPDGKISVAASHGKSGDIAIKITDNGAGIPEDILPRIFEPFFTTKEVGQGMGLGLSISYGIVKRCNGNIFVTSTPGTGTTFTISIPSMAVELKQAA